MTKIKVLSLFSGIGAFEKALTNLKIPYELVGFSEIDKYAIESYSAIHGVDKNLNLGSVTDVDGSEFANVDLLTHGSPCQSFSVAGKQDGGDEGSETKSSLMWETVRVVSNLKPKVVIWENVRAVLGKKHKHNFDKYIEKMDELGYTSSYSQINSKEHNVAQNRPRVFVVSTLSGEEFNFPVPTTLRKTLKDYLEPYVDEKYIVASPQLLNFYTRTSKFDRKIEVKPLDSCAFCLVAKGGKSVVTNNYVYYDLESYVNTNHNKYDIGKMHDEGLKVRALTPLEYWRLQGFEDSDFIKAKDRLNSVFHKGKDKADAQLYKQAGNSITVDVAEKIFAELYKDILSVSSTEKEFQLI